MQGFCGVDPLTQSFPHYSPYQFAGNKPIVAIDLDGLEEYFTYLDMTKHDDDDTKVVTAGKVLYNTAKGVINIIPYIGNMGDAIKNEGLMGPINMVNDDLDKLSYIIAEDMIESKQGGEFDNGVDYLVDRLQEPEVFEQVLTFYATQKAPSVIKGALKTPQNAKIIAAPYPEAAKAAIIPLEGAEQIIKALRKSWGKRVEFIQGTGASAQKVIAKIPEGYTPAKVKGSKAEVFSNGKEWISPDLDGHNGGIWKRWKKESDVGKTTGRETLDADLNYIKD